MARRLSKSPHRFSADRQSWVRTVACCAILTLCIAASHAQTSPPAAASSTFDILEYQVVGNTVLKAEPIERAVYPFLGEKKTIEEVEGARSALEKTYRDAGYGTVLVDIPPQQVKQGVVILHVTEARVERLHVVGAHYFSQGRILEKVPALAEGNVPYFPEVQKELAQVNTSADRVVTPLLRAGTEPGTTDVDLEVQDNLPLHGSVELNNYHAPDTSALRLVASAHYDNLFQLDQRLTLQLQLSPDYTSQVKTGSASYSIPYAGHDILISALRSDSNTYVGGGVGVFGRGSIYGVHDYIVLQSSPGLVQTFNYGIDYKDFEQNVFVAGSGGFASPVRYAPLSLSYNAQRTTKGGVWEYGAAFEFALRDAFSNAQDFDNKRFESTSSFSILKFNASRLQELPANLSLFVKLEGQLTGQPLVSNEQYVAGGVDSVRGYLDATQTGDSALRGTLELRSPNYGAADAAIEKLNFYTFVDSAYLRTLSPLPGSASASELTGIGLGFRMTSRHNASLVLDLAWPTRDSNFTRAWSPRLQANTALEF